MASVAEVISALRCRGRRRDNDHCGSRARRASRTRVTCIALRAVESRAASGTCAACTACAASAASAASAAGVSGISGVACVPSRAGFTSGTRNPNDNRRCGRLPVAGSNSQGQQQCQSQGGKPHGVSSRGRSHQVPSVCGKRTPLQTESIGCRHRPSCRTRPSGGVVPRL